ncbi:MAG: GAF domain-containing protein [Bacteroidales bacterium]|nr:MAG: GAF domain-containing protein [Bacteroidales bacterium]
MDTKTRKYQRIIEQIKDLLMANGDPIAQMATINAVLYHKMPDFFWVGFYLLKKGRLIVGPYQGPLACQELEKNKGVCWAAINRQETIIVPDVNKFPGHIACNENSKSEIVIPLKNTNNEVIGAFDVDSKLYNYFDKTDAKELAKILAMLKIR